MMVLHDGHTKCKANKSMPVDIRLASMQRVVVQDGHLFKMFPKLYNDGIVRT